MRHNLRGTGHRRMIRIQFVPVAATCFALAACSSGSQVKPAAPVAAPPGPTVPLNGRYDGTMQLIRGDASSCGTQDMTTFQVGNGAIHYVLHQPQVEWQPQRVFDVVVAPNGSFQTTAGVAYLRGRINSAGHLQGEVGGDACGFQFEADRSGTW